MKRILYFNDGKEYIRLFGAIKRHKESQGIKQEHVVQRAEVEVKKQEPSNEYERAIDF